MKRSLLCVLELFWLSTPFYGNAEDHDMAILTADSATIPAGGSVTLTCDVKESADLKYEWFRQTSSEEKSIITHESGRVISVSEGGNYTCRAEGKNIILTESDSVTIQKTVRSSITVKLQHSWSQIYTGETITLRCEIQGGEGKVWKYEWTAPNTNSPPTSSEYRISRVSVSHSGDYRCRGSSDYLLTGWSDAFRLTVSFFGYLGENITLPSGVDPSWTLLRIEWSIFTNITLIATYRNRKINTERVPQYTGRLTFNTTSGDLTIHNLKESDATEYTVEIINSEGQNKVNTIKLTAKQKLQQPSIQIVTSTSVESGCLMVVNCSSLDKGVNLSWSVEPVSVLTINKSHPSDSSAQLFAFVNTKENFASFTCISSRDTESVSSKPVTPKCDSKICGFGCERSSFIVPFIIGLVSGIIVVLLLMCCYRKLKKPCCNSLTQSQSTNQSSASQQTANQKETQVYSSLLRGDLSIYESIRGSGNTGSDTNSINFDNNRAVRNVNIYSHGSNFIISADEYNVTSGFQLEGLHKRSRHDGTEESSDYSNVNPESASGS